MTDTSLILTLGAIVAVLTVVSEYAARAGWLPQWFTRKVLHSGAISACAAAPLLLEELTALRWIVGLTAAPLLALVWSRRLFGGPSGERSWGIALFPLPYLALLMVEPDRWKIAVPMAILAFADALAAVIGTRWGRHRWNLTGDPKSWEGSLTFVVVAFLLLLLMPAVGGEPGWSPPTGAGFVALGVAAVLLGALEALGSRGLDNVWIPVGAWFVLNALSDPSAPLSRGMALELGGALLVAIPFVFATIRRKWLTPDGAVTAAVLGVWVVLFQGALWVLPLAVFLVGSTLVGRKRRRPAGAEGQSDLKHGRARDAVQVLCNGGVFGLAAATLDPALAGFAMAVSLSVSAADTWASEVGIAFRGPTMDLLRGRRIPPGVSGGVSVMGTWGGILGAALLAVVTTPLLLDGGQSAGLAGPSQMGPAPLFFVLIGWGFAGMMLDSVLGSGLQVRYAGPDGGLTDRPPHPGARPVAGVRWVGNDLVNLLSNLLVTATAVGVAHFLTAHV